MQFTFLTAAAIPLICWSAIATPPSGITSAAIVAREAFADPADLKLGEVDQTPLSPPPAQYPCRCPNPACPLCRSVVDLDLQAPTRELGDEGFVVLPYDFHVVPPPESSPK